MGQIVQYEAASQVPFPLDGVEWGFEVMGTADTGELDVMLIALREEVIESLSTVCNDLGIRLSVVDGSPAAFMPYAKLCGGGWVFAVIGYWGQNHQRDLH